MAVLALVACSHGGRAAAPDGPAPAPYVAPPAPQVERTPTGEPILYGPLTDMPWCYHATDGLFPGDCMDTEEQCGKDREQTIRNDVVYFTGKLEEKGHSFESAKAASIRGAKERWTGCFRAASAACFLVSDRVSGFRARACTSKLSECQRDFREMSRNADWSVESPTCIVIRARTP